jgi:hypothetical protein
LPLINYYEILGVQSSAGIVEIKAAFRQLAKIYHPDINPSGKEHFTKILKAYETLSDPILKSSYDYKLNYHQAQTTSDTKTTGTKSWKFDEREMKRRRYYEEHIKKYAKPTSSAQNQEEAKSSYNEFRYILLATPLAVILFICVMYLATDNSSNTSEPSATVEIIKDVPKAKTSDLKLGDAPYSGYFGGPRYDQNNNRIITVKNLSGNDIIVCLFTKNNFIRSFFIENNISAEVSQLPAEPLHIKYSSGKYFDYTQKLSQPYVSGAFTEDLQFFKSMKSLKPIKGLEVILKEGENKDFSSITEEEFFKR